MKKILVYFLILIFAQNTVCAATFGTYKPEYEYGLFDGMKFNFGKNKKFIEFKEDIDKKTEESKAKNKEEQDKKDDNEYQMYKFMLENTILF